jgi:hypothetical protein
LDLPQNLILEIQVEDEDKKRKGIQHSLEVEIKWFDDDGSSAPCVEALGVSSGRFLRSKNALKWAFLVQMYGWCFLSTVQRRGPGFYSAAG